MIGKLVLGFVGVLSCTAVGVVMQDEPTNSANVVEQLENEELGHVSWGRDLATALGESGRTGKPILLLFQEVPG